jgi:hypothetical protein
MDLRDFDAVISLDEGNTEIPAGAQDVRVSVEGYRVHYAGRSRRFGDSAPSYIRERRNTSIGLGRVEGREAELNGNTPRSQALLPSN